MPNCIMDVSNTLDQKHLENSLPENSDGLLNGEPNVAATETYISSNILPSETSPEFVPFISIPCSTFCRDTNDVIWANNKDFELPLAFLDQESDSENSCNDIKTKIDLLDEDYKFFLENIRKDGISCNYQLQTNQNGVEVCVKYEELEDGREMHHCLDKRMRHVFQRDAKNYLSRSENVDTCKKPKAYSNCRKNGTCRKCKLETPVASKKGGSKKRAKSTGYLNSKAIQAKHSLTRTTGKRKSILQCTAGHIIKAEEPTMKYDASIVKAEEATLQNDANQIVKEKGTTSQNIDIQILNTEDPFLEASNSNVPAVEILENRSEISRIQSTDFRKNLEATLKEPFNTQQLLEMWNAVNRRKPVVQLRQTRRRTVEVETNQEGSSYLDYHPDLAEKIASTNSPEDKLSLLRGFFFWLKNASWADAFKPWASCYKRESNGNVDDEDDCVEVDRPENEAIAVVLPVEESSLLPKVRVKEELPDM